MAENVPFPTVLAPSQFTERLKSNTRMHVGELSGLMKTVENPGARWEFEFGYSGLDGNNLRAEMMSSAVGRLRGQAKRLQCHNMARPEITGSQSVTNLVGNGDLVLGNTGWTESAGTGGRISFGNGKVRLESGSGTANISRSVTMTGSTYYSAHISISAGSSDVVRVAVGGSSTDFTGSGRHVVGFSSTGTTNIVITNITTSSFVHVGDIIVARAAQSAGVDQTGSVINIDGIDASLDEAIKANDFVSINGELKRVTESIPSSSVGASTLLIEPPMHSLVPDNSLVVLNRPHSKFILDEDNSTLSITAPYIVGFGLNLIEDIT